MGTQWRAVRGYEGLYEVSERGCVRRIADWGGRKATGLLSLSDNRGYKQARLYKDGISHAYRVHRLVADAFIPNPDNLPQVNHKDGDKGNNNVSNLEWVTQSENMLHAKRTGLSPMSTDRMNEARSRTGKATQNILKYNPKRAIIAITRNGETRFESVRECAKCLGVSSSRVVDCCKSGDEIKKIGVRFRYAD